MSQTLRSKYLNVQPQNPSDLYPVAKLCSYFVIGKRIEPRVKEVANFDERHFWDRGYIATWMMALGLNGSAKPDVEFSLKELEAWRYRRFGSLDLRKVIDARTGAETGGMICLVNLVLPTQPRYASGTRVIGNDLYHSPIWAMDDLVNYDELAAKLCTFAMYTNYKAVWTFRPSFLSSSMPLDPNDSKLSELVFSYDMAQIKLNRFIKTRLKKSEN